MDIRDTRLLSDFVQTLVKEQGSIDILVNGAGLNVRNSFLELSEDEWDYVMDVNLKSVMRSCQVVIPYMREQHLGCIINIASLTSQIAFANMPAYCASKAGVSQITKAIAVEFAQDGIRANAIGPGYIRTKMTEAVFQDENRMQWMLSRIPMRRTGEEKDIQGAAIFLASEASSYITGQTIYVDGGWLSS
jgi:NAD(P)-dependent dehydrogenase (short-subunit alcohol dehydrogenase family)